MSPTMHKILILLGAGFDFSYTYHPGMKWKILENAYRQWKKIDENSLQKAIRDLYRSKLIEKKYNTDGSCTLILTGKGKVKTLTYKFSEMKIKQEKWDAKWRIVVFDVPENKRRGRNALRRKLKELGFYELQKSVFIFPYECKDAIDFIVEFFDMRKYIRYGVLENIDNDLHLREIFRLKDR